MCIDTAFGRCGRLSAVRSDRCSVLVRWPRNGRSMLMKCSWRVHELAMHWLCVRRELATHWPCIGH
eukprot:6035008-Lingulodinium_polyedra.AAC.1